MYNRYIRSDHGTYAPIPEERPSPSPQQTTSPPPPHPLNNEEKAAHKRLGHSLDGLKDVWSTLSTKLHLDSGDLLVLAILYFLYREDADEELLIALGLLLFL